MERKHIIGGIAAWTAAVALVAGTIGYNCHSTRQSSIPRPAVQIRDNSLTGMVDEIYKVDKKVLNPDGTVAYYNVKEFDRSGKLIRAYKRFDNKAQTTTPLLSNPDGSFEDRRGNYP
jgi:hypothetical protein